jgi:Uma2 family endonuclease
MAEPLKRPADWQSILEAPPGLKAEVLDGTLLMSPRPRAAHGRSQGRLFAALSDPFDVGRGGPGGWWLLIEPDVLFDPHNIVSPDLCGWRRERLPELPESGPIALAPDWVCEVTSPSSARHDRLAKADLYLRGGVPFYWILDPALRTLEAFAAQAERWVRLGAWSDGDHPEIPPFDALPLDVGSLFVPVADEP